MRSGRIRRSGRSNDGHELCRQCFERERPVKAAPTYDEGAKLISTIDYRNFLGKAEKVVAPVFHPGVAWVGTKRMRVRMQGSKVVVPAPGWWEIVVYGRKAEGLRPAELEDVQAELVRHQRASGHVASLCGQLYLCDDLGRCEPLFLLPAEELLPLARIDARRWPSDDLVWQSTPFESEVEWAVRAALEDGRLLEGVKGAPASLRTAFALEILEKASRATGVPCSPGEVRLRIPEVLLRGQPAGELALRHLAQERARARPVRIGAPPAVPRYSPPVDELELRAEESLAKSGARLLTVRKVRDGVAEVRWTFRGERFETTVEPVTMHVLDAGVCLSDHRTGERGDGMLTLDSLPGVITEAIDGDLLHITRRWR